MKTQTFVTIFTEAQNFHLVKDVGQIPYHMHKEGGFKSKLVCYQNESNYPYLNSEVSGLEIEFIPNRGKVGPVEIGILHYLSRKAKEIDVLHLFHFRRDHLAYILLYKSLNPKGKVYIKLDLDIAFFKQYNVFFHSRYGSFNRILKGIQDAIIQRTDLFSIETREAFQHLKLLFPEFQKKLIYLPNGIDEDQLKELVPAREFQEKENMLITVGRIGTHQKNTELLLEALLYADLGNWKVYVIGPETADFYTYKKAYFDKHPEMQTKVVFTGNIEERKELMSWYNRANVFCLSSRHEGFPLCLPEALYYGNYIISTPLASADDITDTGKYGILVESNAEAFGTAIGKVTSNEFLNPARCEESKRFAMEKFTWKTLINPLVKALN